MSIDTSVIPTHTIDGDKIVGDIVLGNNRLIGNLLSIKEVSGFWRLRNIDDSDFVNIIAGLGLLRELRMWTSKGFIRTNNADNASIIGQSRRTSYGLVEIFRMLGDTEPHLLLTHAKVGARALPTPSADFRGFIYRVEGGVGVADKFYICIKNASDVYEWQDIVGVPVVAPSNIASSAPRRITAHHNTWSKEKEVQVFESGLYQISFKYRIMGGTGADAAIARIYKNGIPYGAEHINNTMEHVTVTEDLTFSAGDLIQLYVRTQNANRWMELENFKVIGQIVPRTAVLLD